MTKTTNNDTVMTLTVEIPREFVVDACDEIGGSLNTIVDTVIDNISGKATKEWLVQNCLDMLRVDLFNLIDDIAEEARADAGISTNYTVDNLCPECGHNIDDTCIELSGGSYGRDDVTVMVHTDCIDDLCKRAKGS